MERREESERLHTEEKGWRRRNSEPEVSIDLGVKNEGLLILRHHHPRQKGS